MHRRVAYSWTADVLSRPKLVETLTVLYNEKHFSSGLCLLPWESRNALGDFFSPSAIGSTAEDELFPPSYCHNNEKTATVRVICNEALRLARSTKIAAADRLFGQKIKPLLGLHVAEYLAFFDEAEDKRVHERRIVFAALRQDELKSGGKFLDQHAVEVAPVDEAEEDGGEEDSSSNSNIASPLLPGRLVHPPARPQIRRRVKESIHTEVAGEHVEGGGERQRPASTAASIGDRIVQENRTNQRLMQDGLRVKQWALSVDESGHIWHYGIQTLQTLAGGLYLVLGLNLVFGIISIDLGLMVATPVITFVLGTWGYLLSRNWIPGTNYRTLTAYMYTAALCWLLWLVWSILRTVLYTRVTDAPWWAYRGALAMTWVTTLFLFCITLTSVSLVSVQKRIYLQQRATQEGLHNASRPAKTK